MKYVTVTKLQDKLNGEANQATTRKLIDRMVREGMVEAKGSRRLGILHYANFLCSSLFLGEVLDLINPRSSNDIGKRVIHSDLTEKKLNEAKKALENDAMARLHSLVCCA